MRRLFLVATSVVILLALFAPAALAAGPVSSTGSVIVSVQGTVDVPAGSNPEAVVVVDGTATISGDADTVVIAGGTATLAGATVDSLVVIDGRADLQAGTTVGRVSTLGGTVTQAAGAEITGRMASFDVDLAALALLLIPLALALAVGFAIAGVVAALLVAAFGARQVRDTEAQISERPGHVLVAGIAGSIGLPLVAVLLIFTVIGAPIGFALLFAVLPVLLFLAWLVAAIWVGDWLVARSRGEREPGRPYRAAVLGVIVLALASVLPFVSAIATVFGLGALLLAGWRVLRPEQPGQAAMGPMGPDAGGAQRQLSPPPSGRPDDDRPGAFSRPDPVGSQPPIRVGCPGLDPSTARERHPRCRPGGARRRPGTGLAFPWVFRFRSFVSARSRSSLVGDAGIAAASVCSSVMTACLQLVHRRDRPGDSRGSLRRP